MNTRDIQAFIAVVETGSIVAASTRLHMTQSGITRRIQSPDCDDALDALALVVAIGVESRPTSSARRPRASAAAPRLSAAPETPAAPPASPPATSSTEGPAGMPVPGAAPVDGAETGAAEAPPVELASPESGRNTSVGLAPAVVLPFPDRDAGTPRPAPEAPAGGLLIGAGLAAQSSVGIAPEPMIGGALWISAEWDRAGAWAPEVVLDALHQERGGHGEARGEAGFALNALSLALCPVRLGESTLELRPCLSTTFGQLMSEGGETYRPRDDRQPWTSIGASVSASVVFGIVQLRASLGASAPLHRDSFRFGPDCTGAACELDVFHRVAPLVWTGALGAGLTPR